MCHIWRRNYSLVLSLLACSKALDIVIGLCEVKSEKELHFNHVMIECYDSLRENQYLLKFLTECHITTLSYLQTQLLPSGILPHCHIIKIHITSDTLPFALNLLINYYRLYIKILSYHLIQLFLPWSMCEPFVHFPWRSNLDIFNIFHVQLACIILAVTFNCWQKV